MSEHSSVIRWQLWIVALGFFMQTLDTTIVNTALPSMAHSLHASPLQMQSVVVSYLLTAAVMLPTSGWLADKCGVKRILFLAIVIFSVGSLFCALSVTLHQLILSRVLQGIGGAMMVPVGRLTVMKIVPREQYMAAMTFVTLPGQIGPLVGPALGGFLVQYATWHWIFLINIPVGVFGAIATLYFMPNHKMETKRFDIKGFILLAVAMATITIALDGHKGMGLSQHYIILLVIVGIIALFSYVPHAKHDKAPLFGMALFENTSFKVGILGGFFGRIGSGMLPFTTPLLLQIGLGFSPFYSGLMMIPMIIGSMIVKQLILHLVNGFGYRQVLVFATLLLAITSLGFPLIISEHTLFLLPIVLFLQGMVNSIRFTTMNTLTLKDLSANLASSGNTLLSIVMQLSMSIGVSIAGILLAIFAHQQSGVDTPMMHHAFIYTYYVIAIILALPAIIFTFVPDDHLKQAVLK